MQSVLNNWQGWNLEPDIGQVPGFDAGTFSVFVVGLVWLGFVDVCNDPGVGSGNIWVTKGIQRWVLDFCTCD